MARRKEMAEQYRLLKQNMSDTINSKVAQQRNALGILVQNDKLTQDQCDEIMSEYEKDLLRIQAAYDEGNMQALHKDQSVLLLCVILLLL